MKASILKFIEVLNGLMTTLYNQRKLYESMWLSPVSLCYRNDSQLKTKEIKCRIICTFVYKHTVYGYDQRGKNLQCLDQSTQKCF